ncbi:hypothetical protein [Priestia megaterium]|uniref:hypothetical protein n=1 Tax=Priestia megaterium TaxID=1404 RepID=UPI000BFB1815|nr:hypothetical protein [Priestia megaterium]PGO53768.1 hypothetical protein CN981_21510 [Priestia megaterium]
MNNKNKGFFGVEEPKLGVEEPKLGVEEPKEATAYTPEYQLRKMKWRFHPHDDDPFPSIPHGHNLDGDAAYKLEVYKGDIYKGTEVYSKLKKSEHARLLADEKIKKLIKKAKKYHADKELGNHPNIIKASNQHDDDSLVIEFETEIDF